MTVPDWGCIHLRSAVHGGWVTIWTVLAPDGPTSTVIDEDPERGLTRLAFGPALRGLRPPRRIVVLDHETAARVVAVVPAGIEVAVVVQHRELRALADRWTRVPDAA